MSRMDFITAAQVIREIKELPPHLRALICALGMAHAQLKSDQDPARRGLYATMPSSWQAIAAWATVFGGPDGLNTFVRAWNSEAIERGEEEAAGGPLGAATRAIDLALKCLEDAGRVQAKLKAKEKAAADQQAPEGT